METKIKNLVKSAVLGVVVLGLAIGASAFTSLAKADEPHLVNKGTSYEMRESYSSNNCQTGNETCAYKVLEPENLPNESNFSPSEIDDFLQAGWIEALPEKGVYQN